MLTENSWTAMTDSQIVTRDTRLDKEQQDHNVKNAM